MATGQANSMEICFQELFSGAVSTYSKTVTKVRARTICASKVLPAARRQGPFHSSKTCPVETRQFFYGGTIILPASRWQHTDRKQAGWLFHPNWPKFSDSVRLKTYLAISSSISAASIGMSAIRSIGAPSVTTMSFSKRTPKPSSGI